ncbi:MAG: hypothetical protein AAGK37_16710 [Pseudomonadota bacterium]
MRSALLLAGTLAFVTAPFWSPGFGGFRADQFPIPQEDPPVQPAGYAFAIWSAIYLWLLVSAVFGLLRRAENPGWDAVRVPLTISMALGAPWITVATLSPVWASVLIFGMLISALWALRRAPSEDRWLLRAPLGLYAGWLTAASLVSVGLLGAGYGIGPDALGWAWVVVLTAIVAGVALQRALAGTPLYAVGVAWALAAVAARNVGDQMLLALLAAIGAAALSAVAFQSTRRG